MKFARMPVTTTVSIEEYAWVKNQGLEFSALLSMAIRAKMAEKQEKDAPEKVEAVLQAKEAELPVEAPRKSELKAYSDWLASRLKADPDYLSADRKQKFRDWRASLAA